MSTPISAFLEGFDGALTSVRVVVQPLAEQGAAVLGAESHAIFLAHQPQLGAEVYACVLFLGMAPEVITVYERMQRFRLGDAFQIPRAYREILTKLNGAHLYHLSLYGIPPSMVRSPPLLD